MGKEREKGSGSRLENGKREGWRVRQQQRPANDSKGLPRTYTLASRFWLELVSKPRSAFNKSLELSACPSSVALSRSLSFSVSFGRPRKILIRQQETLSSSPNSADFCHLQSFCYHHIFPPFSTFYISPWQTECLTHWARISIVQLKYNSNIFNTT